MLLALYISLGNITVREEGAPFGDASDHPEGG